SIAPTAATDIGRASRTEVFAYQSVQVRRRRLFLPVVRKRGGMLVVGAEGSNIHKEKRRSRAGDQG
ncbi:MAG TPA: hypothetical protein VJ508_18130, partial [Saprospiraceae bacterium]|nr:hypothetical protein [Saprospiraceae bacterium]